LEPVLTSVIPLPFCLLTSAIIRPLIAPSHPPLRIGGEDVPLILLGKIFILAAAEDTRELGVLHEVLAESSRKPLERGGVLDLVRHVEGDGAGRGSFGGRYGGHVVLSEMGGSVGR
jgi:hypothetical protein